MSATEPVLVPLEYQEEELTTLIGPDWADRLLHAYRWMVLGRTLDARMLGLQRQGRIGFYGPATGQEAVSVGAWMVSKPQDWIFPGLREQLLALARGHSLTTYLHHLFANDLDPARGRQMPCHPTAREVHYVSMSSVIGTQISQAVGTAYALRHKRDPSVAFAFFGDGATSSNDFHAGLNLAGVLDLPVVFCCTNNQWAISVPVERQSAVAHLSEKATAYGMPGATVDGTDVVAVFASLNGAAEKARSGHGPTMLEFVLYRMTPHSSSDDPTRYQAKDWMARAQAHDPVRRLEDLLARRGALDEAKRALIALDADGEVRGAIATAEKVGPPLSESLTTDVLASPPAPAGTGSDGS
ncbi:MAG: thiamine pyrophosphate-dependent enzyme [Thermoplasmata archaeon]|nr:thiamine pyrophosphate-dependent enzyme [Thermoplasmata archaeon]